MEAGVENGQTTLYLIRHAEAIGNSKDGVVLGASNAGLTDLGYLQAFRLADKWSGRQDGGVKPDALLSSPLLRAFQTAAPLFGKFGVKIKVEPLLVEEGCGKLEGMKISELLAAQPELFFRLDGRLVPIMKKVPAGNSWEDVVRRAEEFLGKVKREHAGKTVIAVSHTVFIYACLSAHTGIRAPEIFRTPIRNAQGRRLLL